MKIRHGDMRGDRGADTRKTLLTAFAVAAGLFLLSAPVVSAATQKARIVGPVSIQDTTGSQIDSRVVPGGEGQGIASGGALDVRTFAGGGGLLSNGDCDGDSSDGRPSQRTVAANSQTIITGIILTGPDAHLSILAPGIEGVTGAGPLVTLQTTPNAPTHTMSFGTGLTVEPTPLVFNCTGEGDFLVLGQSGS